MNLKAAEEQLSTWVKKVKAQCSNATEILRLAQIIEKTAVTVRGEAVTQARKEMEEPPTEDLN
jgi:hypothetical protein